MVIIDASSQETLNDQHIDLQVYMRKSFLFKKNDEWKYLTP